MRDTHHNDSLKPYPSLIGLGTPQDVISANSRDGPMITSATIAAFVAKNFGKIVETAKATYTFADETIQIRLKTAYTDYLTNTAVKFSKSKSFFIRNQPTDLYDYYVPIGIFCNSKFISEPDTENCLDSNKKIVISGSGGSGKTILIKHLFLDCISKGDYVPILIELRDLNINESSLDNAIKETLENFGFNTQGEYIEKSKKAGNFCFFFDGYDEVNHKRRPQLIREIKRLILKYPKCPVIISSRPDDIFSGIEEFSVYHVLPLDLDSAKSLVKKLPFDEEIKNKFTLDLEQSLFVKHESFLSNPLLLSIMLLTYGEYSEIPSKLSIFYNQAYEALFLRHDAYKGGYSRDRLTTLDIQDFARVFSVFSLQTYDRSEFRMSRSNCLAYIEKSKQATRHSFTSEEYLSDLLSAACLLMEDGLDITYSHRSFQEYFVALHISVAPPEIQEKLLERFWKRMRSDMVIDILYELNPDLIERTLIIPKLEKLLSTVGVKKKAGVTHTTRLFKFNYKYLNLEPDDITATLNSNEATEMDVAHLAVRSCGNFIFSSNEEYKAYRDNLITEYGVYGSTTRLETKDLTHRSPVMISVANGIGTFSTSYLQEIINVLAALKKKHANRIEQLESLLGI
ncbi:NACHT domain-containing protein [Pseudomonas sp. DTU_2021_1001937_2_SI_NGA_ILE_001]|uniref:NACHT domain-containing protein n=1 Tax=Pseudomonas sp. DTU_2021_1001937_2_SI_NGA_ILE_001 TaxID=3077589 RepID=UPI0028FC1288|nr:NACHT domain-containing protein [Pseudomonas sp. DTU_2021_1001937_2_SI_NGA_ILE_001]WNW11823.1 NACHT domain-containing protein [Pseudomonas sp. DTU_2021_1001937_2_SI_NGA_ILE_001]